MKDWCVGPLVELAGKLSGPEWDRAIEVAGRENEWFAPGQVGRAVAALRGEMLAPDRLADWLARYRKPEGWQSRRVGIVMAGNLPLVGFADLAAVVAVGHRAVVKSSSKDRALMNFVVRRLQENGCGIETVGELEPEGLGGVIATGGDAARDYFAKRFAGVPALLRGNRQSVAVLTGTETEGELRGLAEDMFLYWGLGCRSVVRFFVPRGFDAARFAEKISAFAPFEVAEAGKYAACYRYARAMAAMGGEPWADGGFFVLRRVGMEAGPVAPKLAEVLWSEYGSADEVEQWLVQYQGALQCAAGAVPAGFPRRVALGRTQYPGWRDYADGVDTVGFLLDL